MFRFSLLALIAVAASLPASQLSTSDKSLKAHVSDYPHFMPENVVVKRTNDSLCTRTLQPINVDKVGDHAVCNWNCQACINNCVGNGFNYYCCENQWCCCYAYGGACARPGVNCWDNGCPHS
jgi:hypothetical protein